MYEQKIKYNKISINLSEQDKGYFQEADQLYPSETLVVCFNSL